MTDYQVQVLVPKNTPTLQNYPTEKDIRLLVLFRGKVDGKTSRKIKHVSMKDKPCYTALSYAWGEPAQTKPISVDERAFYATTSFFLVFNPSATQIDKRSLAMDRRNLYRLTEWRRKARQIRLTRLIYQQAADVMLWLDKSADDGDFVLSTLRMSKQEEENCTRNGVARLDRASQQGDELFPRTTVVDRLWIK